MFRLTKLSRYKILQANFKMNVFISKMSAKQSSSILSVLSSKSFQNKDNTGHNGFIFVEFYIFDLFRYISMVSIPTNFKFILFIKLKRQFVLGNYWKYWSDLKNVFFIQIQLLFPLLIFYNCTRCRCCLFRLFS